MLRILEVRIEDKEKGCVTDNPQPLFDCRFQSDEQDVTIQKCNFTVYKGKDIVWKSDDVPQTINVRYEGEALQPFTEYTVKVWALDSHGDETEGRAGFETGRLDEKWNANWITDTGYHFLFKSPKPMVFRKRIAVSGEIESARIYSTALGVYELDLNGNKVGEDYFRPGFTSYSKLMQYQTYDITTQLEKDNVLTATVAGGWAVGDFTMLHFNKMYAKRQAILMELRIVYRDGRIETIGTDETWEVSEQGNYKYADFYNGEIYDARIDLDNIRYKKAHVTRPAKKPRLLAEYGCPVRKKERFEPVRSWRCKTGGVIYDFGQNFAGVISAEMNGQSGQQVIFEHAEICMDDDIYTKPLRSAKARIVYTCKDGKQHYSPRFTYMGFRYVKVTGIEAENLKLSAFALYSDIETTGSFECSNDDINKLQQNIAWSGKSNFVEIPTDCPQRDERMGWTGDIALFARTAVFNFNMRRFLDKWLLDVIAEQGENGGIPNVVPHGKYSWPKTVDCWADCCVLVPWACYLAYGDKSLLERQYDSLKKHVNAELKLAARSSSDKEPEKYIWRKGFHFGDWCAPGETKKQWKEKTPWVATAYMANSCALLSKIAAELGREKDAVYYGEISKKVDKAYTDVHINTDGHLHHEFQTGYVLPLYFDMIDGETKKAMADRLAELVKLAGNHLKTGFCGTPYLLFALSDNGHLDCAYDLLLQDTCPSWLYEVKSGGTTMWERWDALRPDGTVNQSNNMVSFNHYAYGAVGDWLYRRIAGIEPTLPAYREFLIKPMPGGGLTWARASVKTPYGEIESTWEINGNAFEIKMQIPISTTCNLELPNGETHTLTSGNWQFSCKWQQNTGVSR